MPQALPLTDYISQGSTRKRMNRVLSAQFGDGYSQEAPDGINNLVDEWNVQYVPLNQTERDSLWAALDAVGSWDYLTWTPPGCSAAKWKVTKDGVTETPASGDMYAITFTLKQVP